MKYKTDKIEVNEIHLDINKNDIIHFRFPGIYFTMMGQQILDKIMGDYWEKKNGTKERTKKNETT